MKARCFLQVRVELAPHCLELERDDVEAGHELVEAALAQVVVRAARGVARFRRRAELTRALLVLRLFRLERLDVGVQVYVI